MDAKKSYFGSPKDNESTILDHKFDTLKEDQEDLDKSLSEPS